MNFPTDYRQPQESNTPEKRSGPGKMLAIVLFLAFAAATVLHLYRNDQLPVLQQPLPGFDHPLLSSPGASPSPAGAGGGDATVPAPAAPQAQPLPAAPGGPARAAAGGGWARQEVAELSVESPVRLETRTPANDRLKPAQLAQLVSRYEWEGRAPDGLLVEAIYFQIDGRHTLSLEDGAKGPLLRFAKLAGDPNPAYGKVDGFINGLPARHLSYRHLVNGANQHLEELVVQNSRAMMGIVVTFSGDTRVADAQRILGSLQVRGGN